MASAKDWISAFRLRTLFLAISTVILGSGLALREGEQDVFVSVFAFILAIVLQILANLVNDLGDYLKGTDVTGKRLGPTRALQGGSICLKKMKTAIAIFTLLSVLSGALLVYRIAPFVTPASAVILLFLGLLSIFAAFYYTIGKQAYGYKGWGDLLAFIFFGPIPVIGTYYLHTHTLDAVPLLPAIGLGLISTMILNINNMRDIDNDSVSDKNTVAVKLGLTKAKIYHSILTFTSFFCFLAYSNIFDPQPWYRYLYLLVYITLFKVLREIRLKSGHELDPYLKTTALSGLLITLSFVICINI